MGRRRGRERKVGLVSGEPGIGKTRIVTHCAIERHSEGATVLYGRCEEELVTPFGPWIEALSHYVERAPQEVLDAHVERHGGELARLLPGLERRVPVHPRRASQTTRPSATWSSARWPACFRGIGRPPGPPPPR